MRVKFVIGLFLGLAASLSAGSPDVSVLSPDLVLHSGKIVTVNANFDIAEALAIYNGKIVAVGRNQEVRALAGARTKVIDLHGSTVIPGLIDSHNHPTSQALYLFRPNLAGVKSIGEIAKIIQEKVQQSAPGEWITNSGIWVVADIKEKRNPTRFDLDPVSPSNPVFLNHGHMGVVNTAAMKILGISKETPDPPGGTIDRDPKTGELTGRLYNSAADPVSAVLPQLTHDQLMVVQRASFKDLAADGITSVRSAGFIHDGPGALRALIDLHNRGELPLRVSVMIVLDPNQPKERLEEFLKTAPAASGLGDDMLRIWGVKMFADGGSYSAYLRGEYPNRPGYHGEPASTPANFSTAVRLCNKYGWRVGIHALGDAAIDVVLDAYDSADKDSPISGKRWAIEHAYMLHPEQIERIKRLGLVIHPQTRHLYALHRDFLANYGKEYADMIHPYRTLINNDIRIAGGRDSPYLKPTDAFLDLWVDVTRKTSEGEVVGADQKLTREEALRFHTIWAAYSTFEENVKGSLEPGKFADLLILSSDYLTVPEDQIKDITPLATLVDGKVVFTKDNEIFH
jgi:predicted amidohydrolase YtcJ